MAYRVVLSEIKLISNQANILRVCDFFPIPSLTSLGMVEGASYKNL